jgi:hypothetical protein
MTADIAPPVSPGVFDPPLNKDGFLRGLPRSVRQRIEAAYQARERGCGVRLDRDTCPDGKRRAGQFAEAVYRTLEAAFFVEDEIEQTQGNVPPSQRTIVAELRRRRNMWLDRMGENETRAA